MNQEIIVNNTPPLKPMKDLAFGLYIAHGACLLFSLGMLSWIPLIVNYVKRDDSIGTFVHSHHSWQIRSFWLYFFLCIVSAVFIFTFILAPIGWLIFAIAWIWKAYRLIKGVIDLNENKSMSV